MNIAVIGAGLAGLTAATGLRQAGHQISLFDKSKGTGGRLSSRPWQQGWIDHGAPYLTAESQAFKDFLLRSPAASNLQSWSPEFSGRPATDEKSHFIGIPRNSAITRALLEGIRFFPSTRIARLKRVEGQWELYNDGETLLGHWDALVVAVPAPQAYALVRDCPEVAGPVSQASMEPCWVAAIHCPGPAAREAAVNIYADPVVRRITLNSAKPGRNNDHLYLLQATKEWSVQHLEETAEEIGEELRHSFSRLLGHRREAEILFVHRWRYGFTETPLGESCLWSADLHLGLCGDWCLGRTAEHAWESGSALAAQIGRS